MYKITIIPCLRMGKLREKQKKYLFFLVFAAGTVYTYNRVDPKLGSVASSEYSSILRKSR